jgi:hypothetical protein
LPDGLFSDQKSPLWFIFVGVGMEKLGIIYGRFGTFKSIWCSLPPFGIFCGTLIYIFPIWYVRTRKIWQPCLPGGEISNQGITFIPRLLICKE